MASHTREESRRQMREVGRLIGHCRRKVWSEMGRRLSELGESALAWQLVNRLSHMGPTSQKELAAAVSQHPAGVSRLLEELEGRGLTQSERDPEDRRKNRVSLTAKGAEWLKEINPAVTDGIEKALEKLTPEDVLQLRGLLLKLADLPEMTTLPARKARGA